MEQITESIIVDSSTKPVSQLLEEVDLLLRGRHPHLEEAGRILTHILSQRIHEVSPSEKCQARDLLDILLKNNPPPSLGGSGNNTIDTADVHPQRARYPAPSRVREGRKRNETKDQITGSYSSMRALTEGTHYRTRAYPLIQKVCADLDACSSPSDILALFATLPSLVSIGKLPDWLPNKLLFFVSMHDRLPEDTCDQLSEVFSALWRKRTVVERTEDD